MRNGMFARAAVSSRSRKNSSSGERIRKAARYVIEALEGRQYLTSTWTDLSNATASFDDADKGS